MKSRQKTIAIRIHKMMQFKHPINRLEMKIVLLMRPQFRMQTLRQQAKKDPMLKQRKLKIIQAGLPELLKS